MRFRRTEVDNLVEKKLLINLIMSDRVCKEIFPIIKIESLQIDYVKIILKWIKKYFDKYQVAPKKQIDLIFETERKNLKTTEVTLVNDFLKILFSKEEEKSNEEYLINEFREYIKQRNLIDATERAAKLIELKKFKEAEATLLGYEETTKITSNWVNPFAIKHVNKVFDDKGKFHLFKFPGKLGELIGNLERGFLIGFMGPFKKGKTNWLIELAILGLINKLKVLFVSLEMNNSKISERIYKNITSSTEQGGEIIYPCFDCKLNQDNTCEASYRTNKIRLLNADNSIPNFDSRMRYRPCTFCKENNLPEWSPDSWFTILERPKLNLKNMRSFITGFSKTFGNNNFRLISYPRFSANLNDISLDLNALKHLEGWIPDIIIVDYADILAPEYSSSDVSRDRVDDTWKTLAKIAMEKQCLVATVSQSSKESWEAKNVKAKHASEDYRKLANVDIMMSLNQTEEEKVKGKMRIGVVAHRHDFFAESKQVFVLQNLSVGQALIDSENYFE